MDAEKQKWLEEVGIKKLDKPFTHHMIFPEGCCPRDMYYSDEYLERTSLEELKKKHRRILESGQRAT